MIDKRKSISIVGSGVSGLTCGVRLLEAGFTNVKLFSKEDIYHTTSMVASAIWFPYLPYEDKLTNDLALISYERFTKMAGQHGIKLTDLLFVNKETIHLPASMRSREQRPISDSILQQYPHSECYAVPFIDTSIYLPYLLDQYKSLGGQWIQKEIENFSDIESESTIVNCAGLGAKKLCSDESLYPVRGQIVVIEKQAWMDKMPHISDEEKSVIIFPRTNDCTIGVTAEVNNDNPEVDPATSAKLQENAYAIEPRLKQCNIIKTKVGIRPARKPLRLEAEICSSEQKIIHNYGHAGAGITLSWGCAEKVVSLINNL